MSNPENPPTAPILDRLLGIGAALSGERDINRLLERILESAQDIVNADGGTLYRVTDDRFLTFEILRNKSLALHEGPAVGVPVDAAPLALFENGAPVRDKVATCCFHAHRTINIPDVYASDDTVFTGPRLMDAQLDYRTRSLLAVPMKNHENEIIGIIQLVNAIDPATGAVVPFSPANQALVESLASQAAVALTNRLLIDHLEKLFESFVAVINDAIDAKSPYTHGHCARVPELTMLLAQAADRTRSGPMKDFRMTARDAYELRIAGLLHDCGKIVTPVHVVDKATKLQTIFDRIELIDTRFEIIRRDLEIAFLKGEISGPEHDTRLQMMTSDRDFIHKINIGAEFMPDADVARVKGIACRYRWINPNGVTVDFLSADEVDNLTIRYGTLNTQERDIINHHIDVTIRMLEKIPWPRHLRHVPEYAGGHHERMDGRGYPRGLTGEQMSVQARCMGIADIFEALTAPDRPYKTGKTLSEALRILGKMKLDRHIDPDLFDIFVGEKIYMDYARKYLAPEQIDTVDETSIPGYAPVSAE